MPFLDTIPYEVFSSFLLSRILGLSPSMMNTSKWAQSPWPCHLCLLHSHTCLYLSRLAKCGANTRPRPRCPRCPCPSNRRSSCRHRTTWSCLSIRCLPSPAWTRRWISKKWRCRIFTGSHRTGWLRPGAVWWTGWENTSLESFAQNRTTRLECHLMRYASTWFLICCVLVGVLGMMDISQPTILLKCVYHYFLLTFNLNSWNYHAYSHSNYGHISAFMSSSGSFAFVLTNVALKSVFQLYSKEWNRRFSVQFWTDTAIIRLKETSPVSDSENHFFSRLHHSTCVLAPD